MDKETAMAIGRIVRMRDDIRTEKREGYPIDDPEMGVLFRSPAKAMAGVYRDLAVRLKITPAQDEELTRLTNWVDAEQLSSPMADADQLNFWVAYHRGWDTVPADEAARLAGCTKENIYRLIKDGRLDAEKSNGEWRVYKTSLRLYIDKQ